MKRPCLVLSVLLLSCACRGDEGSSDAFVDDVRRVQAAFEGDVGEEKMEIFLIYPDGTRKAAPKGQVDPSGLLDFNIDNSSYLKKNTQFLSRAEHITAMGSSVHGYGEDAASVVRVEVAGKKQTSVSGATKYLQFPIVLKRSDLLTVDKTYQLARQARIAKVGFQRLKFVDSKSSKPIAGVKYIGVANGFASILVNEDLGIKKTIPLWQTRIFRPFIGFSDAKGQATLRPIPTEDEASYSVIAWADKYCSFVSEPLHWREKAKLAQIIALRACPEAGDDNAFAFEVRPGKGESTANEDFAGRGVVPVIYTNRDEVSVRVDSLARSLRGLELRVLDGLNPDSAGELKSLDLEQDSKYPLKFQSEISVTVPDLAQFTLEIREKDASEYSESNRKYLFVRRSTKKRAVDFASLKIQSGSTPGVISGLPGAKVLVTFRECHSGTKLGIGVAGQDAVYFPCSDGQTSFVASELKLDSTGSEFGGEVELSYVLRDRFGNTSDADSRNSRQSIFVDYGVPDLSKFSLNHTAGITSAFADPGTNSKEYRFPRGLISTDGSGVDTVIVSETELDKLVFRFVSPQKCLIAGGSKDGAQLSDLGERLSGLRIASTVELLEAGEYTACSGDGVTQDLVLGPNRITFPLALSEQASFFLQVKDLAGHESKPEKVSISPCPEDLATRSGIRICWR